MGECVPGEAGSGVTLELSIPSNPDLTAEVDRRIEDLTVRTGFDKGSRGDIMIAVNEAVKNAILHGNQCDESKQVIHHLQLQFGGVPGSTSATAAGVSTPTPFRTREIRTTCSRKMAEAS